MKVLTVSALVLLGLCRTAGAGPAAGFTVRLELTHGHLREVFFGCAPGATAGFDAGHDDLAPPPGIQTGYTAFLPPETERQHAFHFYRDIRGMADEMTWQLLAQVYQDKTIEVRWDPAGLPEEYTFTVAVDEASTDMRRETHLAVPSTRVLTFRAVRRRPADSAPPAERASGKQQP